MTPAIFWTHARRLLRAEYLAGLGIGALATLILWYRPAASPGLGVIALTFVYAGLLYEIGFLANAIGDRELDRAYDGHKGKIATAVAAFGARFLTRLLVALLAAALLLGAWVSWLTATAVPLSLGVMGVVAGVGYSLPPLRWKTRGFLGHFLSLSFAAFFLPVFLMAGVINGRFTIPIFVLAVGYGLAHYGLEISNQLQDYERDKSRGLLTLPADPAKSCLVGIGLISLGLGTGLVGYAWAFHLLARQVVVLALLLTLSYMQPLWAYAALYQGPARISTFFRQFNYARWQAWGMIGYFLAAAAIRLWTW